MDSNNLNDRLANLSPAKRALFELRLKQKAAAAGVEAKIPRRPTAEPTPLSFAQQRLWFLNQLEPESPFYNEAKTIRLVGPLDVEALRKALDKIVARHEVLRTNFVPVDGNPVQIVADSWAVELPLIDLSKCSDAECDRDVEVQRILQQIIERPFDLSRDLKLRALLIQIADGDHVFVTVRHHVASDGWSSGIFWRELGTLYQAFSKAEPDPLPDLPIQYADYAIWQRQWLQGEVLESQLGYWKERLLGIPLLQLPTDRPRPAMQTFKGTKQSLVLTKTLSDQLKALSRTQGATLFMTLLTAFQTLLCRYTGQEDIGVGSPIAGRTRPETEGLIGFFVNTLVLRTDLSGDPSFNELLARVRKIAIGAYERQDLPFEKLVEELNPERNLSQTPLFQVMFALQNVPTESLEIPGLTVIPVDISRQTTKFDLSLAVSEEQDRLGVRAEYSTDLFDTATIDRMLGHFRTLLDGIVANPEQRISELPILTEAEKHQLLVEWNDTPIDHPKDKCIHELFEAQVEKSAEAVAVIFEEQKLTYWELNQRANQLAHYLQRVGVGPETMVGVCVERSIEMIVALLGILKAGGAYVPLDPEYPKDRLAFMLEDTQAPVLLTQRRLVAEFMDDRRSNPVLSEAEGVEGGDLQSSIRDRRIQVVCLDTEWEEIASESKENPNSGATANNLAYVIYTSGSTGKPKGTLVNHSNVARLFSATEPWFHFNEFDVWTLFHSVAFDFSVWELWGALCYGGRLVVVPYAVTRSPEAFFTLLSEQKVTLLNQTPSAFGQLINVTASLENSNHLSLRLVIFGGETLDVQTLKPWFDRHEDQTPRLVNMYGITETTVHVTHHPLQVSDLNHPTVSFIGRHIPDLQLYLLDEYLQPVPVGLPGEIHIGGNGLARGYLNQSDLTAEKFIPNPFSPEPGARLYRTGDRARYRSDGNLEFLGRIDNQVKIRGFRIELGEIESVLGQHPAVRETIVVAREHVPGDKRLVAYVIAGQRPAATINELRSFLKAKLPDYIIPSAFVFLDCLPLAPNGKVDRRALPAPDQSRPELEERYQAPRTPVEEMLAEIWAEVLKLDRVGIHDNFFDLGGHSLLATQVVSRMRGALQVELPLRTLFENPTVAGLAERVEEARRKEQGLETAPILPVSRDKDLPLSFAQQRLWFLDQLEPGSTVYNVPGAVRIRGPLDVAALELSLNETVRRHEALRTTFSMAEREPVQIISPSSSLSLPVVDLTDRYETEREAEARRLAKEEARRPFDLAQGPLVRVTLLRLGEEDHVLLLTLHHIVSDGWSMGVLYRELSVLYQSFCKGQPSPLLDLPIQYADFTVWQREWLQGEVLETQLSYWRKQLADVAVLQLPTDRPRPAVQSFTGARQSIELSKELTQGLKALSRKHDVTLYMTLLAAFQTLLHRYTGQDDIAVGSPIANRNRTEIEGLIGFFVNTLVLRTRLTGNPTFTELIAHVREVALGAYAHQDIPFEKLVEELHPERNLSYSPLFQVMFVLQNAPSTVWEFEGLTLRSFAVDSETAKFDLTLSIHEEAGGLRGSLQYNTDLFDAATVERMLSHFQVLLEGIVGDPERRLSELPLLTEAERHQLLVEWNDTKTEYPKDRCIHELFEAQVEETPDAVAVMFEDHQVSYKELNERANQLAHYLKKLGVGPEALVAICMERSIEMIVGLLGILKAGRAYVPLDPEYPKERLEFMIEDTQASVLLTQQGLIKNLPVQRAQVVCLDRDWELIGQESRENLKSETTAGNLAYVIYTSGSTGKPKGVEIPHRGVVRLLFGVNYVQLDSSQIFLHLAPTSFDASTFEIWGALLHGAKCILFPDNVPSPTELGDVLHKHEVSTLWLTASLFNVVMDEAPEALSGVRQLLIGGEALSIHHVRRALMLLPETKIINGYGPTESTTFACAYPIPRQLAESVNSIPIGRPIGNTEVYILDSHLNPVPIGVPGELYIGGDGLARGYLNQPELTREKFIPNAFAEKPGARFYKTGDRARYLAGGNIEFLGRVDNQIKIRGFRIELEDIESVLRQHERVKEAVVLARENVHRDASAALSAGKRLVAYAVTAQDSTPSAYELRSFLKEKLPDYMIPSGFIFLNSLPLTPNGKVDRHALPPPARVQLEAVNGFIAPRDSVECRLIEIYTKFLGVQKIGVKDNFFDLGGHSLLAVQVISQIEKIFHKSLPVAALFQAPTVEQLASLLREEEPVSRWSSLIPIQTNGSKLPFFWVHGEASDAFLPRYLGPDQPVYGVRHQSEDGYPALYKSVKNIAAHYLDEIRTVQANGPYCLGGYCFGGMVAFEIAQQLKKQNQEVVLLVLLEPSNPANCEFSMPANGNIPSSASNSTTIGKEIQRHWRKLETLRPRGKFIYLLQRSYGRIYDTAVKILRPITRMLQPIIWTLYPSFGYRMPVPLRSPYILKVYNKAMEDYVPRVYAGRLTIFARRGNFRVRQAWEMLALGGIDIHEIPGNHRDILIEPHMRFWAEELRTTLQKAHDRTARIVKCTDHENV